ncbi:proline-rich protein 14 [Bufo gargarizans]|uniref:proline-rich protein 14 n=1 Tax=Bufo gargarizans TaxID=30331 RepID=UPI001CF519F0|nr:proline-rich protein 14 [Bufo gargarizans]
MTSRDENTRHYRRKRHLIYRPPPPSGSLKTPPQHQGLTHALHLASPMEREKRRILSVELKDIAPEVEQLQVQMPPCERAVRSDGWCASDGTSPASTCKDLGVSSSPAAEEHTIPTCQPALKEEPGWGLVPLFNSVRSKLESFAEIFLTPVKSRRRPQNSESDRPGKADLQECSGGVSRGSGHPSTLSPVRLDVDGCGLTDVSPELLHGDGTTEEKAQRTPPNHRLQSEESQSPSILCRPPLQRYLSCPLLPLTQHKRRLSLDTVEHLSEPCKRRRHSLGSMEDGLSFSSISFSLSCLRKENHPSVLRQSPYQPPNSEGSPSSLAMDKDGEPGFSGLQDQAPKESLPSSAFKISENLSSSKENKVSSIRIRKRALRQEGKLTPLGLPKRVRLQKEDFSLEEIYTNKNYHTPTEKRKFETIFEEPITKDGALILTSQRPLRRIMIFKDMGAAPRKRKKKGKAVGRTRRYTAASAEKNVNYELLLQHKLSQLEAALQEDMSDP